MEDIDPTASFISGMGPDVAANLVTVVGLALLYGLKSCCSRDSKCKTKCHLPCIDVEVADRTQRDDRPPSISVDRPVEGEV